MDIENMHPFCLPFGFCHDATSSTADFDPLINNNNGDNSSNGLEASTNNKDKIRFKSSSSPSDELFRHLNNQTNHSSSLASGHSLLNGDHLIIGSSTLDAANHHSFYSLELDINIDVDSSLETGTDICFNDDDEEDDDDDEHDVNDNDDWFGNQYSLLSPTGEIHSTLSGARRKSLIRTALTSHSSLLHNTNSINNNNNNNNNHLLLSNQVFQHVVDPIDIKSSPTLAQLNLNSNDDPTEGLWGETTTNSTSTNQIDLLSNCTSITGTQSHHHHGAHHINHHHAQHSHHHHHHASSNNSNHRNATCNHLNDHNHHHHHHHQHHHINQHQQHQQQQHHVPLSSSSFHNHNNLNGATAAPETTCNHGQHQHQQVCGGGEDDGIKGGCGGGCSRFAPSCNSPQASCNGTISPFRKSDLHQHSTSSPCCSITPTSSSPAGNNNNPQHPAQNLNNDGPNLKTSTSTTTTSLTRNHQLGHSTISNSNNNIGQQQQQPIVCQRNTQLNSIHKAASSQQQKSCQQRSASPALVTSSSSPLSSGSSCSTTTSSSSSSMASNGDVNRSTIDNKLKENIEYLTALLCNGNNKLDYTNQQPSISSTMVRSYATLAHSLSTGPKLLERQQSNNNMAQKQLNAQQLQQQQVLLQSHHHHQQQQQKQPISNNNQPTLCNNNNGPTNEASSCPDAASLQQQEHQPNQILNTTSTMNSSPSLKRPHAELTNQWFKVAVETSVSPADSTESSQVSSLTTTTTGCDNRLHGHHCQAATTTMAACQSHHQSASTPLPPPTIQQQQQVQNNNHHHLHQHYQQQQQAPTTIDQRQRISELKVLSSLLQQNSNNNTNNNNKCTSAPQTTSGLSIQQSSNNPTPVCGIWSQDTPLPLTAATYNQQQQPGQTTKILECSSPMLQVTQTQQHLHHQQHLSRPMQPKTLTGNPEQQHQQQQQTAATKDVVSIPPNGKPITLTPIATNNGILIQQKPRTSLFAQPASPSIGPSGPIMGCGPEIPGSSTSSSSTSSTSSSSSSASSSSAPAAPSAPKRQRSNNQQQAAAAASGTASQLLPLQQQQQRGSTGSGSAVGGSVRLARPSSMSTDCSLSSHDEGFSSQIDNDDCGSARGGGGDSDDDEDIDSDDESFYGDYTNSDLIGASISDNEENKWTLNMGRTRRNGQKRYFWQYNVQSKGPKGTRICSTDNPEDPFVLPEASDPVFSNDCQVEGVKHSGKARRGDGNDLTPNPRKLLMIGLELKKLGKIINELAPVTDLPINARNKTRKEKNKLASRACRLKKKAQHEANKIKLYGLQREHQQVVVAIYDIRKLLNQTMLSREANKDCLLLSSSDDNKQKSNSNLTAGIDNTATTTTSANNGPTNVNSSVETMAEQCSMRVAGQTSDYVNSVLEKVVRGCIDGGLQT